MAARAPTWPPGKDAEALVAACAAGDTGAAQRFLDGGADANAARESDGATPLFLAFANGHRGIAWRLLDHKADPNLGRASDGATALILASQEDSLYNVRRLLDGNANPNQATTDCGFTPLMCASQEGRLEIARLLLDRKANPDQAKTDANGCTPLTMATCAGHVDITTLLLDSGADPMLAAAGTTALYAAAWKGHLGVAELLLDRDADPNAVTINPVGYTPLHVACQEGFHDIAALLLARNPVGKNAVAGNGATPLHIASHKNHISIAALLLENGANPHAATTDVEATPLFVAARNGNLKIVQLLATYGADVSTEATLMDAPTRGFEGRVSPTRSRVRPHHVALMHGHNKVAMWLGAVASWPPMRIAVACRLHREARFALRVGAMGDPTLCRLKDIYATAAATDAYGAEWQGLHALPVCADTNKLAREAMARWSPSRHWLHHKELREAVHTVLLVREHLHNRASASEYASMLPGARADKSVLPPELYACVCSWLLRRHWPAPPEALVR